MEQKKMDMEKFRQDIGEISDNDLAYVNWLVYSEINGRLTKKLGGKTTEIPGGIMQNFVRYDKVRYNEDFGHWTMTNDDGDVEIPTLDEMLDIMDRIDRRDEHDRMVNFDEKIDFTDETLVITDPSYITDSPERLGMTSAKFIQAPTGWGDVSSEVVDDGGNVIGEFCVDSGEMIVIPLKDVEKISPDFLKESGEWTRAVISNFTGNIRVKWTGPDGIVGHNVITGNGNVNFHTRFIGEQ